MADRAGGAARRLVEAGVTEREAEVLRAVAERLRDREIAARLHLSVRTVESHVAALRRKLGDPGWITTARGVGFRLTVPGDHSASEGSG